MTTCLGEIAILIVMFMKEHALIIEIKTLYIRALFGPPMSLFDQFQWKLQAFDVYLWLMFKAT